MERFVCLLPKFLSYILSFTMVLIYWNNHHHIFQTVEKVNGKILLANGFLLFCLSLVPFATAWMGEHNFESKPVILMGIVLLISGIAYFILSIVIAKSHGKDSVLYKIMEKDWKGVISIIGYSIGVILGFHYPEISAIIYFLIALIWLIPDKRIERLMKENER